MPEFIRAEKTGRVGVLTIDRPKQLNALNPELMQELGAALLAFDAALYAIVFTGAWGTSSARNRVMAIPMLAQGYTGRAK